MKLVDSAQMNRIDTVAQEKFGIPGIVLMENAARSSYERLIELRPDLGRLTCVTGSGNNGGDALALARHAFVDGLRVRVVLIGDKLGEHAATHARTLAALGVETAVWPSEPAERAISEADTIIDGLYGTGVVPPLRRNATDIVEALNSSGAYIASIDIPSGVGDGFRTDYPAIRADLTLCIALPKRSHYLPHARAYCGKIEFVGAGFPPTLLANPELADELVDEEYATAHYPTSDRGAYKGSRGRVGVYAGSEGTTGAAVLCSQACARVGAGMVYLNIDRDIYQTVASHLVSVMPRVAAESLETSGYDSLLVGPGWGFENRLSLLEELLQSGLPGVIDADAITLLAKLGGRDLNDRWVITPHPGELARLVGVTTHDVLDDPYRYLDKAVSLYNTTVMLKSHVTILRSTNRRIGIVDGMNPYLGTAGSGDVLSGCIAGLIARGAISFDAATVGAYIHASAGRRAGQGGWFLAQELCTHVSCVSGELQESAS
jgi:ADP-dependent NAD(P)H-hydrate dehydratase / NAD(P)H-hydrate epimerase